LRDVRLQPVRKPTLTLVMALCTRYINACLLLEVNVKPTDGETLTDSGTPNALAC